MLCPAYTRHLWSHREGSNLQPTDYKTVALPVELRWHIPPPLLSPRRNVAVSTAAGVVRFSLRFSHPGLGGDIMISHSQVSFQRDSTVLTLKGCHSTRSQPVMATGRPLVISLARYATPIRQYSVSPQSAPWPLERLNKLATAKSAGHQAQGRNRTDIYYTKSRCRSHH